MFILLKCMIPHLISHKLHALYIESDVRKAKGSGSRVPHAYITNKDLSY